MRMKSPSYIDVSRAHIAYSRYYEGGWVSKDDLDVVRYLGTMGMMELTQDPDEEDRIYAKPSKLGRSIWMPWPTSKWS
ncbi:MAG: hypothetical protein Q4Q58_07005 [Thermoplasmata archaeon]|nr:hypothetical protein [Thermoplasmata archaeon]